MTKLDFFRLFLEMRSVPIDSAKHSLEYFKGIFWPVGGLTCQCHHLCLNVCFMAGWLYSLGLSCVTQAVWSISTVSLDLYSIDNGNWAP